MVGRLSRVVADSGNTGPYEKKARGWVRRGKALKAEQTRLRREQDWFRFAFRRRRSWLTVIHMRVRQGLKARERGLLFMEGENAAVLAEVRKDRETREKQSIGAKRMNERRRNACAQAKAMLQSKHEAMSKVSRDGAGDGFEGTGIEGSAESLVKISGGGAGPESGPTGPVAAGSSMRGTNDNPETGDGRIS
jgi:hypothetical protein